MHKPIIKPPTQVAIQQPPPTQDVLPPWKTGSDTNMNSTNNGYENRDFRNNNGSNHQGHDNNIAINKPRSQPLVKSSSLSSNNGNSYGNKEWNQTLDSNIAGMAGNAEDFTKQFMTDMYGSSGKAVAGQFNDVQGGPQKSFGNLNHTESRSI